LSTNLNTIGLNIPLLLGVKLYSITAKQLIQRVDNTIATGGWTSAKSNGFVTTALQDTASKWYDALTSRDLDSQD
jgi:hypothetical protein